MSTKNDILNRSFDELRVSGLTVSPRPTHEAKALIIMESMMAEWLEGKNFTVDYNFEQTPDLNSESNIERKYENAIVYNVAVRLIPMFNKQVPDTLLKLARGSFTTAKAILAQYTLQQVQPSRRMPRGSGQQIRSGMWNRYQIPVANAPNVGSTNYIQEGETQEYKEDFSAWLGGNTISSYAFELDERLTKDSDSEDSGVITYTVTASESTVYPPEQYVKITVTDSESRVLIRLINFQVQDVPDVGA